MDDYGYIEFTPNTIVKKNRFVPNRLIKLMLFGKTIKKSDQVHYNLFLHSVCFGFLFCGSGDFVVLIRNLLP